MVLDADGLNAVSEHINVLDTRRDRLTVLTPHDGEFFRLTHGKPIGPDRAEAASAFALQHGCVLVLKGHRTSPLFQMVTFLSTPLVTPAWQKGGAETYCQG